MFKTSCLAAVTGIVLFAVSAAVPGKAFAATTDYATEDTNPSDPATVNTEHRQYAQKRGGGRGAKRKPGASSRSRGARPSTRPSTGAKKRPGSSPSKKKPGRDVNVNRNVNVNVRHHHHGWRGARWGAVVFGVTLGTAIVVAANTPPYPPDPSLCWSWNNAALTSGYWYYCDGL
jgi:hypothetical protein